MYRYTRSPGSANGSDQSNCQEPIIISSDDDEQPPRKCPRLNRHPSIDFHRLLQGVTGDRDFIDLTDNRADGSPDNVPQPLSDDYGHRRPGHNHYFSPSPNHLAEPTRTYLASAALTVAVLSVPVHCHTCIPMYRSMPTSTRVANFIGVRASAMGYIGTNCV
jgi:hypothetical protein